MRYVHTLADMQLALFRMFLVCCAWPCATGLLPFAIGSETWGSVVCPATTVGVTAFRPTGGSIPGHGMMQVLVMTASLSQQLAHVCW